MKTIYIISFAVSFLILALISGYYYYKKNNVPKIDAAFVGSWETNPEDPDSIKLFKNGGPVIITITPSGKVITKLGGKVYEEIPAIINSTSTELILRYESDISRISICDTHYKMNQAGDIEVTKPLVQLSPNAKRTVFQEYFLRLHRTDSQEGQY